MPTQEVQRFREGDEVMKITFLGVAVLAAVALIAYAVWMSKGTAGEQSHGF